MEEAMKLLRRWFAIHNIMRGSAPGQGNNPVKVIGEIRKLTAETEQFLKDNGGIDDVSDHS